METLYLTEGIEEVDSSEKRLGKGKWCKAKAWIYLWRKGARNAMRDEQEGCQANIHSQVEVGQHKPLVSQVWCLQQIL